jgi:site-specific DNA-methyltransferase (adenine-specific)
MEKRKYPDDFINKIICGNCLEVMQEIPDKSIDLVLTDMPYGSTACDWDKEQDLEELWEIFKRIGKDDAVYVFTASQPFTSKLVMSNLKWFKYEWIWNKKKPGNIFVAKYQPLKIHENVLVFSNGKTKYNPQMVKRDKIKRSKNYGTGEAIPWDKIEKDKVYEYTHKYPQSIIEISNAYQNKIHPTQKPVELMAYLIKTYTEEGDLVLDPFIGSGTTAIACLELNRRFIGIDILPEYCEMVEERIKNFDSGINHKRLGLL